MSYPHRTRFSDSSLYDFICEKCGSTDSVIGGTLGDGPCPVSDEEYEERQREIQREIRAAMKEKGNG